MDKALARSAPSTGMLARVKRHKGDSLRVHNTRRVGVPELIAESPMPAELRLRIADAANVLSAAKTDEDGELDAVSAHGLLSALDYALRGEPGCVEPEEWQERRRQALVEHGEYLGLGR